MTNLDPQQTRVMPVNDTTTNDDTPTQTLDPDRIRTQNAPTETMPPIGVNDDGGTAADAAGTPVSAPVNGTATDNAATDGTGASPTAPNADALPTQPIIGKPEVALAGTEYETDGAAQTDEAPGAAAGTAVPMGGAYDPFASIGQTGPTSQTDQAPQTESTSQPGPVFQTGVDQAALSGGDQPAPEQPWAQQPQSQPMAEQPMNPQEAAWSQQQAAAQGYADEAQRNSYPGSGNTAQATAGSPYQNYPGWNQYAPNTTQPYAPKVEYRKGPSTPTIIWGTLVALFALGGLGGSWLFGFSMSLSMWTIFAILALVVMGVTLVVGGVVSAVRRKSRKPKA